MDHAHNNIHNWHPIMASYLNVLEEKKARNRTTMPALFSLLERLTLTPSWAPVVEVITCMIQFFNYQGLIYGT